MEKYKALKIAIFFFGLVLVLWLFLLKAFNIPEILLPHPVSVFEAFLAHKTEIFKHTFITILEALSGGVLAIFFAFVVAILVVFSKLFEDLSMPMIVILKTCPMVVVAPLLAVYLGSGLLHKIVIVYFVCFLPILIALIKGLRSLDEQLLKYLKVIKANKIKALLKVQIPQSLPYLFVGLKAGVPLAFLGAIIGEMIVPAAGLGYLVSFADTQFLIDYQFAVIIWLGTVSFLCYWLVVKLESVVIYWQ
jgi:NitT/TauT family transport system permease protein